MAEIRLAGTCWKFNTFRRGDSIAPAAGLDFTLRFDEAGGVDGFGGQAGDLQILRGHRLNVPRHRHNLPTPPRILQGDGGGHPGVVH
jgi:hypothetical protein